MRTSAHINAEIFNAGPALFEAVRAAVIEHATVADSPAAQRSNQATLQAAIGAVVSAAAPAELDHRALWQVLWQRVVYAGTRASNASAEIASMRSVVPWFGDLDAYLPEQYVFERAEWVAFARYWKERVAGRGAASAWLALAKRDADWNPAAYFADKKTSPAVWQILIKDEQVYPGLSFSANSAKLQKHLAVARFLHDQRSAGAKALSHYTGGIVPSDSHQTGQAWLEERAALAAMRTRLAAQLGGDITALHAMMDLGLKTIKPDRVMTFLFSQLGWLQTLPAELRKSEVLRVYMHDSVVEEMTIRADVLAAALDRAGYAQAHRLLDIWFVKYGQEPEADFGITVNLQAAGPGIRALFDAVVVGSDQALSDGEAADSWPCAEFAAVGKQANGEGNEAAPGEWLAPVKGKKRSPLDQVEQEQCFMLEWKRGRACEPPLYPARIDNKPKHAILGLIRRHVAPAEAFRSVLG